MNKFTRSQMGKIMAYALSAAMAVTVVPTYMMKPLVAEAATTETSKEFTEESNGSVAETTLTINSGITAADQAVEFYVTTTEKDTYNISANGSTDKVDGATVNGSTATVSETNLKAKATNDGTYYVYANYVKDGAVSEDASNLVKVATIVVSDSGNEKNITPEAGFTKDDSTNDYKYTVEAPEPSISFYVLTNADANGTAVSTLTGVTPVTGTVNGTSATVSIDDLKAKAPYTSEPTTYTVYYAYNKTGAVEGTDTLVKAGTIENTAAPTFAIESKSVKQGSVLYNATNDAITSTSKVYLYSKVGDTKSAYQLKATDYNGDGDYEIVVPYTVAAGKYYIADEEGATITANTPVVEILEAKSVTNVSYSVTNSTVYYFGQSGSNNPSNTETVTVDITGDTVLGIEVDAADAESKGFTVNSDAVNNTKTFTVKYTSAYSAEAVKGKVKIKVFVAGKQAPYERTVQLKAVKGTSLENGSIKLVSDNEIITDTGEAKLTTVTSDTQERVKYNLTGVPSGYITDDSDLTSGTIKVYKVGDIKKKTVATYDIEAKTLKSTVPGEFKVEAKPSVSAASTATTSEVTVNVIQPKVEIVAGTVGTTSQNSLAVSGLNGLTSYATYNVENTDVASVIGITTSGAAVSFANPGITKVTAEITIPTSSKFYKFEASNYIVAAPKDDDEDFDITSVANPELYANKIEETLGLGDILALQLADGINNGSINAKTLSKAAVSAAEEAFEAEYSNYYNLVASDSNVTATGLLFAAYDEDVVNVQDPDKRADVELAISDLQAKDQKYNMPDSVLNFVAEATVDKEVIDLNQPVWLTVTSDKFEPETKYTVYDNGEAVYTALSSEASVDGTVSLTFQTDSFSVFSIVADPTGEITDNTADFDTPDETDIYDLINVTGHVQDIGDMESTVSDDRIISIGTHGNSKRLEKITIEGLDENDIVMTGHVQDTGDVEQEVDKETGAISVGTDHQSKRLEAFSLALKGDLAEKYDVYYRVHVQDYGWLDWAKNGEVAGTSGHSFRLEAVEIMFVEKGTEIDKEALKKTYEEGNRGKDDKAAYMDRVVASK